MSLISQNSKISHDTKAQSSVYLISYLLSITVLPVHVITRDRNYISLNFTLLLVHCILNMTHVWLVTTSTYIRCFLNTLAEMILRKQAIKSYFNFPHQSYN